jgi:hypothetical protein
MAFPLEVLLSALSLSKLLEDRHTPQAGRRASILRRLQRGPPLLPVNGMRGMLIRTSHDIPLTGFLNFVLFSMFTQEARSSVEISAIFFE